MTGLLLTPKKECGATKDVGTPARPGDESRERDDWLRVRRQRKPDFENRRAQRGDDVDFRYPSNSLYCWDA